LDGAFATLAPVVHVAVSPLVVNEAPRGAFFSAQMERMIHRKCLK